MLNIVRPLLSSKTATINFTLNKLEAGGFNLIVNPVCCIDDHEDAELQALKAALSLPIIISGNLDELEPALVEFVKKQIPHRYSWEEQVKAAEVALQTAKASKAAKPAETRATKADSPSNGRAKIQEQSHKDTEVVTSENNDDLFDL